MDTNNNYKIELVNWEPIYNQKLATNNTIKCNICFNELENLCTCCETSPDKNNCCVSSSKCCHFFHFHCIDKWLSQSSICPTCSIPFNYNLKDMDVAKYNNIVANIDN